MNGTRTSKRYVTMSVRAVYFWWLALYICFLVITKNVHFEELKALMHSLLINTISYHKFKQKMLLCNEK